MFNCEGSCFNCRENMSDVSQVRTELVEALKLDIFGLDNAHAFAHGLLRERAVALVSVCFPWPESRAC